MVALHIVNILLFRCPAGKSGLPLLSRRTKVRRNASGKTPPGSVYLRKNQSADRVGESNRLLQCRRLRAQGHTPSVAPDIKEPPPLRTRCQGTKNPYTPSHAKPDGIRPMKPGNGDQRSLKLSTPSSNLLHVVLDMSDIHRLQMLPIEDLLTVHCPRSGFVGSGVCHLHKRHGFFVPTSICIILSPASVVTARASCHGMKRMTGASLLGMPRSSRLFSTVSCSIARNHCPQTTDRSLR